LGTVPLGHSHSSYLEWLAGGQVDRMELMEKKWKRDERNIARAFGTERILEKGRDVPDFETDSVVGEVKSRKALPKWLTGAVAQARRYAQPFDDKLPVVCLKEKGMRGFLVVIHSDDFMDWYGDVPLRRMDDVCLARLCTAAIAAGALGSPVDGLPCFEKRCPRGK